MDLAISSSSAIAASIFKKDFHPLISIYNTVAITENVAMIVGFWLYSFVVVDDICQ